jgi:hypothetical protein
LNDALDGYSMILTDNETKVDLLNYEAIAATIVELLRQRPDQPMTVGVHGDWGAGKSSVLEMIDARIGADKKALCLKFNGWRFQGFEDAKIALIEGIVTGLLEKRPMLTRATQEVKEVFKRIDWLKVAKKAGGLALTTHTGIPMSGQIADVVHVVQALIPESLKKKEEEGGEPTKDLKGLLKPKSPKRTPKEIEEFRKAFDKLLTAAGIDQLVVLIDDLDRCLPDTAIETLEAVRLFVFTSRTAFVVAADEAMIEYAVRKHFPDLPDTTGPMTYSRNYLEKLIQVPFRIPSLGDIETRIYVTLLLAGTALGENDAAFNKLIEAARERLKRPWTSAPLDSAAVKSVVGDRYDTIQNELLLSEQIGPTLASGTSGNPRQIKRFLNAMILRHRTAQARGFGDEVKLPILAKLMLAERFLPQFFDQIGAGAATAADGKCLDLVHLETLSPHVKADSPIESAWSDDPEKTAFQPTSRLREWLTSPGIRSWAQVQPAIGDLDLRPYLFIAKDRKDYFGAATVLGHLANVAEKLLGPKIAVQGLESSLRKLAFPEAAQIFDAVRGRIVGGDSFHKEPPGAPGLAVLVRAHPDLQATLVDFLENLPVQRLGPWVCSGWDGVIKDATAAQRFDRLLGKWAKDGPVMLKTAASGVLKTRQRVN